MKLTVERKELTERLSIMSKVVRKNSIMPSLEGIILLPLSDNEVEIKGSNLRTNLTLRIPSKVEGRKTSIIPLRGLLDVLRKLPDEHVILELTENEVKLHAKSSDYSFRTYIPDEYPDVTWSVDGIRLSVASKELLRCLNETSFATSSSSEYAPSYSQGIQLEVSDGKLTVAASDGQRLAVSYFDLDSAEDVGMCAVPVLSFSEISSLISSGEIVDLVFSDRYIAVESVMGVAVLSKLNVRIPDYGPVLEKAVATDSVGVFDRGELVAVLDRLVSVSSDSYLVKVEFGETSVFDTVGLTSGTGSERVECEYSGDSVTVYLSIKHLLSALKSLTEGKVELFVQESMVAMRKHGVDDFIYVVSTASVADENTSEYE